MKSATSDTEIVNSRDIPFSLQQVFDAFSARDDLARWWGPKGFTNTFHTFEFKPGGRWHFTMHSPEGQDFDNESIFTEVSEPTRVTIEHVCPPKFVLEITLASSEQGTALSWVQRFETKEVRDQVVKYAGNANEENLDRLEAVLAGKSKK